MRGAWTALERAYIELGEQESEERRRNGEGGTEHDPEIPDVHFGDLGVLCDDAEV